MVMVLAVALVRMVMIVILMMMTMVYYFGYGDSEDSGCFKVCEVIVVVVGLCVLAVCMYGVDGGEWCCV